MNLCISRINWTTFDCSASQARLPYNGSRLHPMRFESISAPRLISDVVYALWLQSFAGRRSERVRSSHFLRPLSSQRVFADLGGCCGTLGRLHEGLYGSITLFDHFFVSMDYLSQIRFSVSNNDIYLCRWRRLRPAKAAPGAEDVFRQSLRSIGALLRLRVTVCITGSEHFITSTITGITVVLRHQSLSNLSGCKDYRIFCQLGALIGWRIKVRQKV